MSLRPGLHVTQRLLGEVTRVVGDGEVAVSDGLGVSEQMAMFTQQHGVHRICVDPARPPRAVAGWRGVAVTAWWRDGVGWR